MQFTGIDMASDCAKCVEGIAAAGLKWVGRYYRNPNSHFPPLTLSEARLLASHNLLAVTVWEAASTRGSYFTYETGADDATSAYRQAHTLGQPLETPIYFAVDFDASPRDITTIRDYFNGVKAGFLASSGGRGSYSIGVYGSGRVCIALLESNHVAFTWLACSRHWAGNQDFKEWNIKQHINAVPNVGCDHDSNETQGDYGGFKVT